MKKFLKAIFIFYSPRYPAILVQMLAGNGYKSGSYLATFWQTQNFATVVDRAKAVHTRKTRLLTAILFIGMLAEILAGLILLYLWHWHNLAGGLQFGIAVIVAYPVVWAHLLPLVIGFIGLPARLKPKRVGRAIICGILEGQVKQLRKRHSFSVIAVAGSVGKTSTKLAIAQTLAATARVRYQEGNYNDRVTVPLVFFEHDLPGLFNLIAWMKIFRANRRTIRNPYPYKYVVVELGTDGPGQMQAFAYLNPDISVVTAITVEHMEYFGTLDAIAAEELSVFDYSDQVLVNSDDISSSYLVGRDYQSYGFNKDATYRASQWRQPNLSGGTLTIKSPEKELKIKTTVVGKQGAKVVLAAVATAQLLKCTSASTIKGAETISAFAGRMRIIEGQEDSTIIDDSYNASPAAVTAGLDVLYDTKAKQRIAILGSMNELGDSSAKAHQTVGKYCDAKKLAWVITIGAEAKKYLAPAALKAGCRVESFLSPYDAGAFARQLLSPGTVVLAEGSQNGVFAEESLKALLKDEADIEKLVRQSKYWLAVKQQQFPRS